MPIAPMIQQATPCPGCGYDLRGLRLDGKCPECGRPTIDTFARNLTSSDGHILSEMLGISGRLLPFFLVAVAFAAIARHVPVLTLQLPTAYLGTAITLAFGAKSLMRVYAAIGLRRRFAVAGPIANAWSVWVLCVVGAMGSACVGVAHAGDLLLSAGSFGVAAVLLAGGGFLAGSATTGLLKQSSLRSSVPQGPYVLAISALLFCAVLIVPMPLLGAWVGLLTRVILAIVLAGVWWLTWLRYQEALRVGLGPVTSL